MAVSNGQGLATGPILLGDVGQIFKLGINGHTNTQIRKYAAHTSASAKTWQN